MHHEDPNCGPSHSHSQSPPASLPVVMPPASPSSMLPPTPVQPTNPSNELATPPLPGMARPKPRFQPLEIPPRPNYQPGSPSPTLNPPSTSQPMVIGMSPSQGSQVVMSTTPHSQSRISSPLMPHPQPGGMSPLMPHPQAGAMSPKIQCPSPAPQRQPVAMSPTTHHQSIAMPPTPHLQPMMMMPPPDYQQPYMFPPQPYYHPGPPYNPPMMQAGFQPPNHYYPEHERAWSTNLFDCNKDIRNCTRTICCPCVTFGQIAEIVNEGTTPWYEPGVLCALLAAVTPCFFICHASFPYTGCYRTKLRKKYKLKGSVLEDCLVHTFCECCALCQEYRELDHQGFDVPLGWHENKRRERQAVAIFRFIPPEEQGMTR